MEQSREEKIQEIRNWLNQQLKDFPLSIAGARETDTAFLLDEIERLQAALRISGRTITDLVADYDVEVSQLREEKDSLEEALRWYADKGNYNVNLIDQWGPHTPVLHDNGKRACWALGIGVDNDTINRD